VPIDTRLTAIKDKHATWIINAFNLTRNRRSVVKKSWQQCGLLASDVALTDHENDNLSLPSSSDSEAETIYDSDS
jgi:hypothetical protein